MFDRLAPPGAILRDELAQAGAEIAALPRLQPTP